MNKTRGARREARTTTQGARRGTRFVWTILLGGFLACGKTEIAETPPLPVTISTVGASSAGPGETRYGGAIEADASVDVAFRVNGVVEAITQVRGADGRLRPIQDGDLVQRGAVLARLRQDEYSNQVSRAEAEARQAQADYERAAQLYENRSVSKADYDAAYARYTATRAAQSTAEISRGDATLRAPITGVVIRRNVEVGSLGGPTVPAFTVADTRVVKVVFGVPDIVVARLKLGGDLGIEVEALPGEALEGRITRISPSADPNSRVFEVEASLPNKEGHLKVGMLATLRLAGAGGLSTAVYLPLAAVVRPVGDTAGYAVYVVQDSGETASARIRPVSLGDVRANLIAVTSGVTQGERVIVRGATIVADGQPVRILP
jgi:multidrug efflux system membrane fusion protein